MKKMIRFSKFFLPAAIISAVLMAFAVFGYFFNDGFALGVDFQAGLIQEIQVAPTAFSMSWHGSANATLRHNRAGIDIIISGAAVENVTHSFLYSDHDTIGSLASAMGEQLEDLEISLAVDEATTFRSIVISVLNDQYLSRDSEFVIQFIETHAAPVDISQVRTAMAGFDHGTSVQSMGAAEDRHFMVRIESRDGIREELREEGYDDYEEYLDAVREEGRVTVNEVVSVLENYFSAHYGSGCIAVLRSDFVDSRFSRDLTDQAGILILLTLLLVLLYSAFRFKFQYAVGAVIAIIYDVIIIVAFVIWIRMEFTTLTIAAILTILGYSTNNTIIFFDRIRENMRIYSDHSYLDILNISLNGILGRTVITTATTMLAVLALFIFTTGSMQDFALALLVGMTSGVYTTLFLVSGFVYFWEKQKVKRQKKKLATA